MFKLEILITDLFPVGSHTGFGVCKTPSILPLGVGSTLQVMKRPLLLPTLVQTLYHCKWVHSFTLFISFFFNFIFLIDWHTTCPFILCCPVWLLPKSRPRPWISEDENTHQISASDVCSGESSFLFLRNLSFLFYKRMGPYLLNNPASLEKLLWKQNL